MPKWTLHPEAQRSSFRCCFHSSSSFLFFFSLLFFFFFLNVLLSKSGFFNIQLFQTAVVLLRGYRFPLFPDDSLTWRSISGHRDHMIIRQRAASSRTNQLMNVRLHSKVTLSATLLIGDDPTRWSESWAQVLFKDMAPWESSTFTVANAFSFPQLSDLNNFHS